MLILCRKCMRELPVTSFGKRKHTKNGMSAQCKECWSSYIIARYPTDKLKRVYTDKKRAWHAAYHLKNRDHELARGRAWVAANPERARLLHATQEIRRRTRKALCIGSHTSDQWLGLCGVYGMRCAACHGLKPLTRDHIVPLSKGGTDYISNIQPLCRQCNSAKRTKTIDYRRAL